MGSAFAMHYALGALGIRSRVECADSLPEKFQFLFANAKREDFAAQFVLAVDVADENLLGATIREKYPMIDLCIDHHPSNTGYAQHRLLEADSAATAEIIALVIESMGVSLTSQMAACIYTCLLYISRCV